MIDQLLNVNVIQTQLMTFIVGKEFDFNNEYNPFSNSYYLMLQFLHQTNKLINFHI